MAEIFDCKCCGHCCEGAGGIVVSQREVTRLCEYLHISEADFEQEYGERVNGKLRVRNGSNGFCIFFTEGVGCAVHTAKPDVCRAWPFFRGNLVDPVSLALAKDYCPGIPRDMSFEDFVSAGVTYLHDMKLVQEKSYAHALDVHELLTGKKSKS